MTGPFRTLTFAAPDASVWGAVLAESAGVTGIAVADGLEAAGSVAEVRTEESGEWRIETDGATLAVEGHGPVVEVGDEVREQLCRVSGAMAFDGRTVSVEALGRRSVRSSPDRAAGSWRDVSVWAGDHGVAVHAERRAKASGHSDEAIATGVFEPGEEPVYVAEARLSTTYADGRPLRVGVELWLGQEEADQYPLRMAGEASAPGLDATLGAFDVHAMPIRAHWRGHEGAGLYLLARRR